MENLTESTLDVFLQYWWLGAVLVLCMIVLRFVGKKLLTNNDETIKRLRDHNDMLLGSLWKNAESIDKIASTMEINQIKLTSNMESLYKDAMTSLDNHFNSLSLKK